MITRYDVIFGLLIALVFSYAEVKLSFLPPRLVKEAFETSNGGQCPFSLTPKHSYHGSELDTLRVQRVLSHPLKDWRFLLPWLNSTVRAWANETPTSLFNAFYNQLGFHSVVQELFTYADVELLVGQVNETEFLVVYVILGAAMGMFVTYPIGRTYNPLDRAYLLVIALSRFVLVIYGVGGAKTSSDSASQLHENVFFFIWGAFLFSVQIIFFIWEQLFMWAHPYPSYHTVLIVAYTVFALGTVLFIVGLLFYVVFPKSAFLQVAYTIMLTADALRLMVFCAMHILHMLSRQRNAPLARSADQPPTSNSEVGAGLPNWVRGPATAVHDFLEAALIFTGIYHGLLVRECFFVLCLSTYGLSKVQSLARGIGLLPPRAALAPPPPRRTVPSAEPSQREEKAALPPRLRNGSPSRRRAHPESLQSPLIRRPSRNDEIIPLGT